METRGKAMCPEQVGDSVSCLTGHQVLVHGFQVPRDMVPRRSRGAISKWNEEKP